jgi:hypothetical protein
MLGEASEMLARRQRDDSEDASEDASEMFEDGLVLFFTPSLLPSFSPALHATSSPSRPRVSVLLIFILFLDCGPLNSNAVKVSSSLKCALSAH